MTLPLLFGGGFPIEESRVTFASLIVLKAVTAMTIMTILLTTQTIDQFVRSLAELKIPPIIITILLLSYRYVFLFFEDIQRMQVALKSRFFSGKITWRNLNTYGQLTGALLLRSLDRADKVYNAMRARCFDGNYKYTQKSSITKYDVLKSSTVIMLVTIIIIIEKVL